MYVLDIATAQKTDLFEKNTSSNKKLYFDRIGM